MFGKLRSKLARMRKHRATMNELYSLSDAELSDIGITRGDIPRIAKSVN